MSTILPGYEEDAGLVAGAIHSDCAHLSRICPRSPGSQEPPNMCPFTNGHPRIPTSRIFRMLLPIGAFPSEKSLDSGVQRSR